ncbi:MAG: hypothetical protein RBR87_02615 [Bacteroidales bacterium]|jgi:hypothetical protein|nr:hypothetical protein [Bacteroidales bacterium]
MLVIADGRMPDLAKKSLSQMAEPLWIAPQPNVYESIAAHPDIFFCSTKAGLVTAPKLPAHYLTRLQKNKCIIIKGSLSVGSKYPQTAIYNALATDNFLIHNLKYTAAEIKNQYAEEQLIHVNQAYTRCNIVVLTDHYFITSDVGVYTTLRDNSKEVFLIDPQQIMLPGHQHGFFGGCCGIFEKQLVICGHIDFLTEKNGLQAFAEKAGFSIKALYYGKLFDVGSLLFV